MTCKTDPATLWERAEFLVAIITSFLDILIIVKQIDNMRSIRLFNGMIDPILNCYVL